MASSASLSLATKEFIPSLSEPSIKPATADTDLHKLASEASPCAPSMQRLKGEFSLTSDHDTCHSNSLSQRDRVRKNIEP